MLAVSYLVSLRVEFQLSGSLGTHSNHDVDLQISHQISKQIVILIQSPPLNPHGRDIGIRQCPMPVVPEQLKSQTEQLTH
jgi:hypothetical protein